MNLDSGRTCSTVLTLDGLVGDPGVMASTKVLSKVQEDESLRSWISGVKGSEDELPHNVPEQPDAGFGPMVAPPDPGVVAAGAAVVAPGPGVVATGPDVAAPLSRLHSTFASQSQALIA